MKNSVKDGGMDAKREAKKQELDPKEVKDLREELWIILPFFIISSYFFFGGFQYKVEARTVPLLIGAVTAILSGMRLFHIFFPRSSIGKFRETGLAGEFDHIKEEIEEEVTKDKHEEEPAKEITFRDERKAFYCLIGCFISFLLFGYLVGMFIVIIGSSYYYNYKKWLTILISLASMFSIIYLFLNVLMEAPIDYGVLLSPILRSLDWIR
jgi:hypothetical protein